MSSYEKTSGILLGTFFLALAVAFPASASENSFIQDIEKIRRASLQLNTETARVRSAAAQSLAASLFWTPVLSATAGRDTQEIKEPAQKNESQYWGASASWNFSTGGGQINALKAARLSSKAHNLQLTNETLRTEQQAANLIFQVLRHNDQLAAQKELLSLKEESHRILKERFRQGKAPLQEVEKSEIDLSQQTQQLDRLELETIRIQAAIRSLFVDSLQTKKWPFDQRIKIPNLTTAPSVELESLRLISEASEHTWKASRSLHLPTLGASMGYNSRQPVPSSGWTDEYYLRLEVTIPIWSRMEVTAQSLNAKTESIATQNSYEIARRSERENRTYLQKKLEMSQKTLSESQKNIEKASRVYKALLRNFRMGRLSTYELFDEQSRVIESRKIHSENLFSFHQAVVEVCNTNGQTLAECLKP